MSLGRWLVSWMESLQIELSRADLAKDLDFGRVAVPRRGAER